MFSSNSLPVEFTARVHPEWRPLVEKSLTGMDKGYLQNLATNPDWLPGMDAIFAAFQLPLSKTRYILFGESPYPRMQSANGFAFWDGAVGDLWCNQGLSKTVNRATSLRNLMKMLLVARKDLNGDTSKEAIASLDKSLYVQTATELFNNMMQKGILLLNASMVFQENEVRFHASHWLPFMKILLETLSVINPSIELILFGKIAENIPQNSLGVGLISEHPYNISFIHNPAVLQFFKPFDLLSKHETRIQY